MSQPSFLMFAKQARAYVARSERGWKQMLCSRLRLSNGFATDTEPLTPVDRAPPLSLQRRRKRELMITPTVTEREYAAEVVHGRALLAPLQHEKTHGVPVAILQVRGYNHRALDLFMHFASHAASALAIPISQSIRLPTQRSLWTVPKGPFVHKKNQENFDRKVHKRMLKAWDATDNVVERWIRYIQTHPQPGIGMRVVRWHRAPLSIGRKHEEHSSETQMESMKLDNVTDRQRVEEVARDIVKQEMAAAGIAKDVPKVFAEQGTSRPSKSQE